MSDKEIWKDIEGYIGKYQVSNLGRIRSLLNSHGKNLKNKKILSPCVDKKGYLRVGLSKNNRLSTHKVHRLVAKAFIPNSDNLPQVNHINGIKTDNTVNNLEWVSGSENVIHSFKIGLSKKGKKHHCSKLSDEQVKNIRNEYIAFDKKHSQLALSKKYGVSKSCIKNIVNYKTYKDTD